MKVFFFLTWIFFDSTFAGLAIDNLYHISEKINSLKTTWKAKNNYESHETISSFIPLMGVLDAGDQLQPTKNITYDLIDTLVLPDEFDARKNWPHCPTIQQIRNQGNCGSCWAVAAAGAMSDRMCITTNGTFTDPISAEELLSCCEDCGKGCQGGIPIMAWQHFMLSGLVTGGELNSNIGCQPYTIEPCKGCPVRDTPKCKFGCADPTNQPKHFRSIDSYVLPNDVRQIQKDIFINGPVEADFMAYSDLPVYQSGVYKHEYGNLLGGHAVRLIGWGKENDEDYWLVANSWGQDWGDQGTFKIKRGTNECGIESRVTAGIPHLI